MSVYFYILAQAILYLFLSPLLLGWIKIVKCFLQNRKAPSLFQPYYNLIKLFQKQVIVPKEASWIFRFTPYLVFSAISLAAILVPLFVVNVNFFTSPMSDIIVLIGLFALARFFLALAGMDIGTAFGGMGSSREMLISSLVEPSSLLVLFTLAMSSASTNLTDIMTYLSSHIAIADPALLFALIGLCMVTLAENGRIPIDNPATHLELTMLHEAMVLEYSGRYLALIEWSSAIKLMIYFVLIVNLFFPWGFTTSLMLKSAGIAFVFLMLKLMAASVALGVTETALAKMRLFKAPYFLSIAFMFCLLAVLCHVLLGLR
jgi:formate hydrogenlyase subunit 4